MATSLLYTSENQHPPENVERFLAWYVNRHAPDLYKAGFLTCASYRSIEGGINTCGVYEIPNWEIFETPAYRAVLPGDPYRAVVSGAGSGVMLRAHTVYEQRPLFPTAAAGDLPALNADWIALLRFDAPAETERDIIAWMAEGEGARQLAAGAVRLRIGRRAKDRPESVTHHPRCIILAEWPEQPPTGAETWRRLVDHFGGALSRVATDVSHRLYPWPDRPLRIRGAAA